MAHTVRIFETPAGEVLPADFDITFVVETANRLGLAVYDDQTGEARFPGGHAILDGWQLGHYVVKRGADLGFPIPDLAAARIPKILGKRQREAVERGFASLLAPKK